MMQNNNPFVGTNRIRFIGYDLSPSGRAPLCFTFTGSKGKKKMFLLHYLREFM